MDPHERGSPTERMPGEEYRPQPSEFGDDDKRESSKKRLKRSRDENDGCKGRKFACHFHKYNPRKYSVRKDPKLSTSEQIKWRLCGGQGSQELRYLM
jgi:hypothetical protein